CPNASGPPTTSVRNPVLSREFATDADQRIEAADHHDDRGVARRGPGAAGSPVRSPRPRSQPPRPLAAPIEIWATTVHNGFRPGNDAGRGEGLRMSDSDFRPGLEGVVAFESEIAEPDREGGALRYRGVDISDLVGGVSFGNVWVLLVDNDFTPGLPPAEPFPL